MARRAEPPGPRRRVSHPLWHTRPRRSEPAQTAPRNETNRGAAVRTESHSFEFWVAHDHPERPFDGGVFLCECDACRIALEAAARANPRFTFVIRSNLDRVGVTADHLLEVWQRDGCIERLLYL